MNTTESIARDGDAFIDRRIEPEIIVLGLARGDRLNTVEIDDVFSMTLNEWRGGELFGQLVQALD